MYGSIGSRYSVQDTMAESRSERSHEASALELFVEQAVDYAIAVLDSEGTISSWNIGAEGLLGYRPEEIIGQHFSGLFTPDDRAQGVPQEELKTAASTGRASDDRWTLKKDGTRIWVSGTTTAVRDARALRFVKIMRDGTSAKLVEDEIRKLNQELMKKVKELDASRHELYEKVLELESFQQVVVGRELRMVELEQEIEVLRRKIGRGSGET
jgi:PAS domain S-box-containing protein